jgi:hypothetical protein
MSFLEDCMQEIAKASFCRVGLKLSNARNGWRAVKGSEMGGMALAISGTTICVVLPGASAQPLT